MKAEKWLALILGIGFIGAGVCVVPVIWGWFDEFRLPYARFDAPIYSLGTGLYMIMLGVRLLVGPRTGVAAPKGKSKSSGIDAFISPG